MCIQIHVYYNAACIVIAFIGRRSMILWYHYAEIASAMDMRRTWLVMLAPLLPAVIAMKFQHRTFSRWVPRGLGAGRWLLPVCYIPW